LFGRDYGRISCGRRLRSAIETRDLAARSGVFGFCERLERSFLGARRAQGATTEGKRKVGYFCRGRRRKKEMAAVRLRQAPAGGWWRGRGCCSSRRRALLLLLLLVCVRVVSGIYHVVFGLCYVVHKLGEGSTRERCTRVELSCVSSAYFRPVYRTVRCISRWCGARCPCLLFCCGMVFVPCTIFCFAFALASFGVEVIYADCGQRSSFASGGWWLRLWAISDLSLSNPPPPLPPVVHT